MIGLEGGLNEICHVFFLVKEQDKGVSAPIYQGFHPIGAEVCAGVLVMVIDF